MKIWHTILLGGLMALNAEASELYAQKVKSIDGKEVQLAAYKGKTLLIVNTASQCGYTPQYDGLEALYKKYKDRGLVVMGFPSNDFGAQEPGSNQEIKNFCQTRFKIDFPMFEKASVKGPQAQPLYQALLKNAANQEEVKWNFEKFLVSPDGRVVARFGSKVTPDDAALVSAIEKNLPKTGM